MSDTPPTLPDGSADALAYARMLVAEEGKRGRALSSAARDYVKIGAAWFGFVQVVYLAVFVRDFSGPSADLSLIEIAGGLGLFGAGLLAALIVSVFSADRTAATGDGASADLLDALTVRPNTDPALTTAATLLASTVTGLEVKRRAGVQHAEAAERTQGIWLTLMLVALTQLAFVVGDVVAAA